MNAVPPTAVDFVSLRQSILGAIGKLRDLSKTHTSLKSSADSFEPAIRSLKTGIFRLVIMGEVKKGKSSFINALLGIDGLLPTDTDIATSTVFKILYGPKEKYTVFFQPASPEEEPPAPQVIDRADLLNFGTESGNPGNVKKVDFIAVEFPCPLLREGLVLVDTPGVGGLFRGHREITFRYAPQADAVIFVVDSVESVISKDEVLFLSELLTITSNITFVQTKSDQASTEQVTAWKTRNQEILQSQLGPSAGLLPYFVVSSKLKQMADKAQSLDDFVDSGFNEVVHHIHNRLVSCRDQLLLKRWLPSIIAETVSMGRLLSEEIAFVQQASQPQVAEYENTLKKVIVEFDKWQSDIWPKRLRDFQDDTGRIKRNSRNELFDALAAENSAPPYFAMAKQKCKTPEQVEAYADELRNEHAAHCNTLVNRALESLKRDYVAVYHQTIGQATKDLQGIIAPLVNIPKADSREYDSNVIHAIREASMTANALQGYVSKAAWLVGAVSVGLVSFGWIAPVTAMGIIAVSSISNIASQIWFNIKGYKMGRDRQLAGALANLESALARTAHSAQRAGNRAMEETCAELDIRARDGLEAFRSRYRSQFESRRQEIATQKVRSESEVKKATESSMHLLRQVTDVAKLLKEAAVHVGLTPENTP